MPLIREKNIVQMFAVFILLILSLRPHLTNLDMETVIEVFSNKRAKALR